MAISRPARRKFLTSVAASGAAAVLEAQFAPLVRAQAPTQPDLQGLRSKISHIVVIFQENGSFDHYFGAYGRNGAVNGLLDRDGHIYSRFTGLQKSVTGAPSGLTRSIRASRFANARLENSPFHLAPYIPSGDNVAWDPSHYFNRMFAQIDGGKMDYFVALALLDTTRSLTRNTRESLKQRLLAASSPSAAVLATIA